MPGLSDGGWMFLSMSTARMGGVTFSGFSLLCIEGEAETKSQENKIRIHWFTLDLLRKILSPKQKKKEKKKYMQTVNLLMWKIQSLLWQILYYLQLGVSILYRGWSLLSTWPITLISVFKGDNRSCCDWGSSQLPLLIPLSTSAGIQ